MQAHALAEVASEVASKVCPDAEGRLFHRSDQRAYPSLACAPCRAGLDDLDADLLEFVVLAQERVGARAPAQIEVDALREAVGERGVGLALNLHSYE